VPRPRHRPRAAGGNLALREYWLGLYPTPEERLVSSVEALTAVLGPPGELWTLEASPHAPTVAVLVYRGRRIGYLGSTATGAILVALVRRAGCPLGSHGEAQ
jgi:hypothetical protein